VRVVSRFRAALPGIALPGIALPGIKGRQAGTSVPGPMGNRPADFQSAPQSSGAAAKCTARAACGVPPRKRRQESRRGTHECVRHRVTG